MVTREFSEDSDSLGEKTEKTNEYKNQRFKFTFQR